MSTHCPSTMICFMKSSMNIVLYGIPNCDTVKKARAWLDGQGVAYRFHDFKKQGVPGEQLDGWISQLGWERLVNRQGTTWRKLDARCSGRREGRGQRQGTDAAPAQRHQASGRGMGWENHGRLRSGGLGVAGRLKGTFTAALPKWQRLRRGFS